MNITIVGGGPIGLYTGFLLSKQGFNVNLFEEHKVIGKPIACSGLLTQDIKKYRVNLNDCIVNKFNSVSIHSKNVAFLHKIEAMRSFIG